MKINKYLLTSSLFLLPLTTSATEDISVLVYGASIHSGCEKAKGPHGKTCDFNNINPGLGVDWAFLGNQETGKLSLRGGGYEDSYEKFAAYAGFMYRKEWYLTALLIKSVAGWPFPNPLIPLNSLAGEQAYQALSACSSPSRQPGFRPPGRCSSAGSALAR